MNLLLVTFSLRNQFRNYDTFFVALRGNAIQWWHFIEETCVVLTQHDVNEFARLLYPHMEANDSLLVVKLTPHEFQGWLPKDAWEWLGSVSETLLRQSLFRRSLPPST